MGRIRLGHAALRLRLPRATRPIASALADEAQATFLPALLEHFVAAVEEAAPTGAFIRIRHLRLRAAATLAGFRDGSLAEAAARDLAGQVLDDASVQSLSAMAGSLEAEVQVWASPAEWWACRLDAALARREGPEGRQEEIATLIGQIAALPRHVRNALRRTVAEAPVESALSAPLPASLTDALDLPTPPPNQPDDDHAPPTGLPRPPADAPDPDPTDPAALRPPMHKQDRDDGEVPVAPDAPRLPFHNALPSADIGQPAPGADPPSRTTPRPGTSRALPGAHGPEPPREVPSATLPGADAQPPPATEGAEQRFPAPTDRVRPPPEAKTPAPAAEAAHADSPQQTPTNWGGAAYLLNISLALDIPERLWRIGVDEGETLAAMIDHLTGAPGDPLAQSLRPDPGASPPVLSPVPEWAREELVAGALEAARGRARSDTLPDRVAEWHALFHSEGTWNAAHWLAALHAGIVEDLLDLPLGPDGLNGILRQSGILIRTDDEIRLRLPLSAIDIDLRRQGLDRSPGFLAWLDRRFVIDFEPDTEDHATEVVM